MQVNILPINYFYTFTEQKYKAQILLQRVNFNQNLVIFQKPNDLRVSCLITF